jgi:HprK-related kinase A
LNPIPAGKAVSSTLGESTSEAIDSALAGPGLDVDIGSAVFRIQGDAPTLPAALRAVYRHHRFATTEAPFVDLHVHVERVRGVRRWLRPQVTFRCDSVEPFDPFPASNALPLLEWGVNWLIGQRFNNFLLLHSGAVEKDGHALLLPATPGSGKSTLTAALSLRGWRLLSDEFGVYDPAEGRFSAMLKPVALKNESIDVIRAFAPKASLGPAFPKTRKGTVAHLASNAEAVERCRENARPGAFILPRWRAGSPTTLEPVLPEAMFGTLAFNAFNYRLLGAVGFDAVLRLARSCPAWTLLYSDLSEAVGAIDALWPGVVAHHAD